MPGLPDRRLTRRQFERLYAQQLGVSPEEARRRGYYSAPAVNGESGWQAAAVPEGDDPSAEAIFLRMESRGAPRGSIPRFGEADNDRDHARDP